MLDLPKGIIQIRPTGNFWKVFLSKTEMDFNLATKILEENKYTSVKKSDGSGIDFTNNDAVYCHPMKNVYLDKSWLWAPLEPGEETYEKILGVIGLIPDRHWYYRDIVTPHIPDMMLIIEHFTTIDVSKITLDYNRGLDVLDDLAIQTGRPSGAHKSYNLTHQYVELKQEFDKQH